MTKPDDFIKQLQSPINTLPQQMEIIWLFTKLYEKVNKELLGKAELTANSEIICRAVWSYMAFSSEAICLRNLTAEEGSKSSKRMRADYAKIEKLAGQLSDLLETTAAGESIADFDEVHMLSILEAVAGRKKEEFTPDKGRNKSQERQWRLSMVATLSGLANENGIYTGTGNTGNFPDFIRSVYEILGIKQFNLSKDLSDSKKTPTK